jgi:poly(3-hydroxyalkanoate) synthetase
LIEKIGNEGTAALQALSEGIQCYQATEIPEHSYNAEPIHKLGLATLYYYRSKTAGGVPILFVPSLINRATILDLSAKRSFLLTLASLGLEPYLLDWGELLLDSKEQHEELEFSLSDYFSKRLKPIIEKTAEFAGQPVIIAGYCMGGLLAVASAFVLPRLIAAVATIATPWEFNKFPFSPYFNGHQLKQLFDTSADLSIIPAKLVQLAFSAQHPIISGNKFLNYKAKAAKDEHFALIENWVNDGVNLSGKLLKECLLEFSISNRPIQGTWQMEGKTINARHLNKPSFCAIARDDKVAPLATTLPLAEQLNHPHNVIKITNSGHIAPIISRTHNIANDLAIWALNLEKV